MKIKCCEEYPRKARRYLKQTKVNFNLLLFPIILYVIKRKSEFTTEKYLYSGENLFKSETKFDEGKKSNQLKRKDSLMMN